jgi:hypothetical protein
MQVTFNNSITTHRKANAFLLRRLNSQRCEIWSFQRDFDEYSKRSPPGNVIVSIGKQLLTLWKSFLPQNIDITTFQLTRCHIAEDFDLLVTVVHESKHCLF